jgi:hypothetical protein
MATINIGNLAFTHKGDYDGSTAYAKNDVVYYSTNGNAYIAKQATTGNAPTNATYWNQFAQGSGGIWNAGLSLGSASQVVKVNAAGNALEFGTLSSDYVKLASGTFSTSSDNLILDGFTSSDYKSYVLRMQSASTNNSGNSLRLRFRQSGSDNSAEYLRIGNYNGINTSNSSTGSFNNISNYNQDHYPFGHHGSTNEDINYSELVFNQLTSTTMYKIIFSRSVGRDGSGQWTFWNMGGMWRPNSNAVTGIKIYTGSGNFTIAGNYEMYGIK